jgi:biopolymer transport protein ExbB
MFYKFIVRTLARLSIVIVVANTSYALANNNIQNELLSRITQSKKELMETEKSISQKSSALTKRLDEKQNQIVTLRKEAAAAQRIIDEQLLSLDQLKTRVERWETQSTYQAHLLNAYVESVGLSIDGLAKIDGDVSIDASVLDIALNHLESRLKPKWMEKDIVSPQGTILKVQSLSVGPVNVAYDLTTQSGGPLTTDNTEELRVLNVFNSSQLDNLRGLQANGHGYLTFDPTLGNAYKLMNRDDDLQTHLVKGGVWAIPIVLFGLFAFIIAVIKAVELYKLPKIDSHLTEKITKAIAEFTTTESTTDKHNLKEKVLRMAKEAGGAQAKLIHIAMSNPLSQRRDDLLVAYLMEYKHTIERFMGVVASSAAIAPLLGLLGTVSGMISMFKMMTIFGSGDATTVSGGISEALITTELGLIVAIPSLIVSALLTRKTKSYNHMLETFAIKLSKIKFSS